MTDGTGKVVKGNSLLRGACVLGGYAFWDQFEDNPETLHFRSRILKLARDATHDLFGRGALVNWITLCVNFMGKFWGCLSIGGTSKLACDS